MINFNSVSLGHCFPGLEVTMWFFGLLKMIWGVEMALKITVDSFEINQYLLFSNVYAISLYLSYLILFDRQTNRPTYQERHRSSYQEVKKFMGKRFSMNLTFSSFLPFPLSPPHNHHPDPPPLLSPPLPPHPLPLPSPPPTTSHKGRISLLVSLPLFCWN